MHLAELRKDPLLIPYPHSEAHKINTPYHIDVGLDSDEERYMQRSYSVVLHLFSFFIFIVVMATQEMLGIRFRLLLETHIHPNGPRHPQFHSLFPIGIIESFICII